MAEETKAMEKEPAVVLNTLFKPGSWLAQIDFMNHLTLSNNVLITVLAEPQGGKSSFCAVLIGHLDKQITPQMCKATASCEAEQLLEHIVTQLHFDKEKVTSVELLAEQITATQKQHLIIIDDAQHVPESFIKDCMLATKKQGDRGFFHLCLVSDYSLSDSLDNLSKDAFNNLIHKIDLGPLSENETKTYLLQRATSTNLLSLPLPEANVKEFFQNTKGNLAKINAEMAAFIANCKPIELPKNKVWPKRAAALGFSFVLGAVASYWAASSLGKLPWQRNWTDPREQAKLAALTAVEPVPTKALALSRKQFRSEIPSWLDSSHFQTVEATPPTQEFAELQDEELENEINLALVDKVVVIPKITPGVDLSRAQALLVQEASNSAVSVDKKNRQLAKKSTKLYTIQLVASHEIADVNRFRESIPQLAEAKLRHFTNVTGSWYILTLGEYVDPTQAQLQSKQLPPQLSKLNPWVRPLSGLTDIG